jgi:hypothetical protein
MTLRLLYLLFCQVLRWLALLARSSARFLVLEQDFHTAVRNSASPLGCVNSARADVRGVVRDPSSARPFGGLELGALEQVSDEER